MELAEVVAVIRFKPFVGGEQLSEDGESRVDGVGNKASVTPFVLGLVLDFFALF